MKLPRNEKGISLVELLAVFVISAILVLLIVSIQIYSQKQFQTQRSQAEALTDITIAMKEITKAVRMHTIEESSASSIKFSDGTQFDLRDTILYKNNTPFIYEVSQFTIERAQDQRQVDILIESENGQQLETTLIVR